ncbi:MAG TPA: hypothetical protein VFK13_01235 [Gemmatimonadaceae bacterium]|nr:hypothetical protein [Gemmatimonadaceae bacterium]
MFKYLFAYLVAPLLRPIFNAVLTLLVVAFVITIPARLWALYVDPRPSEHIVAALNVATFALLVLLGSYVAIRRIRRAVWRARHVDLQRYRTTQQGHPWRRGSQSTGA